MGALGENPTTLRSNPAMHSLVEMFFDVDDFCQDVPITQEIGYERRFAERAAVEAAGFVTVSPNRADNFDWFLYDFNKGGNWSIRDRNLFF